MAIAVGFFVIGSEWYLLARPTPRVGPLVAAQVRTSPTPSELAAPITAIVKDAATITPAVGTPSVSPSLITVSTPTMVTVTVQISPTPIAGGVNLLELGATGTQPTILGVMHDDGLNGDAVASDGIYTLQVPFNESTSGQIQVQASVAFSGALRRTVSVNATISVWNKASTSTAHIIFPPTLLEVSSSPSSVLLQTTSLPLAGSGGETNPNTQYATSGYGVDLEDIAFSNTFDIGTFIDSNFPGSPPTVTQLTTADGAPAFRVDFSGESGDYPTMIIVPISGVAHVFSFFVQSLTQQQYSSAEDDFTNIALSTQ